MATHAADDDKKAKTTIGHYCEISTCMGVVDWYLENRPLGKIFWAILILFGLSITALQTGGIIADYIRSQPFERSVSAENGTLLYPNVTICNFNRAKRSLIERDSVDSKVLSYLFQMFPATYDISLRLGAIHASDLKEYLTPYQQSYDDFVSRSKIADIFEFFHTYGHNVSETFIRRTHNGEAAIIKDSEITEIFTIYGRCWKINVNIYQVFSGAMCGINLILNPVLDEYLNNVVYNNYAQQGFVLSLSEADEPFMSNPILLAPGTSTYIHVKPVNNQMKEEPILPRFDLPCNNKPYLPLLNETYTPINCIYDCYMQAVYSACRCILFGKTRKPYKLCDLFTAVKCASPDPVSKSANSWDPKVFAELDSCTKVCQPPCYDYKTYETSLSTTKFAFVNKPMAMEIVQNILQQDNVTVKDFIENAVSVKIFYSSKETTTVETREKTSILQFISNTGGQLGLWMGISIFSIIQIIYYLTLAFINGDVWCKCGRRNRVFHENVLKIDQSENEKEKQQTLPVDSELKNIISKNKAFANEIT